MIRNLFQYFKIYSVASQGQQADKQPTSSFINCKMLARSASSAKLVTTVFLICRQLPAWVLILLVRGYQLLVSPWLGPHCRFQPTCSAYFIASVKKHGALRGTARGLRRIGSCHPFHPGGWDPP